MRTLLLGAALAALVPIKSSACIIEFGEHHGDIVTGTFIGCSFKEYKSVLREFLEDTHVELLQRTIVAAGTAEPSYFKIVVKDSKGAIKAP